MKQFFPKTIHQKFQDIFSIKKAPGTYEILYLKKAQSYLRYIKRLPGLLMAWVGNSVAMNSANKESDIDLFIITTPKTLWFNKLFLTLYFQVLWVRISKKHHAGRFCLSFFVTTNATDFSSWKWGNDVYLYFWIIYLKPILNYNQTYEHFLSINSSWADFSPYHSMIEENKSFIIAWWKKNIWENIIIQGINTLCKKIFLPKTLKYYKKMGNPDGVIITDGMLKLHEKDIRKQISQKFT